MPLEDDQRTWLNAALQGKGRIKSAGIKKQFANYTRRRRKIAAISDALPETHSNTLPIRMALTEADRLAAAGDFGGAYKSLDRVKALARATDKGTSGQIHEHEILQRVRNLENVMASQIQEVDRFFSQVDLALANVSALPPCRSMNSLADAVQHRKTIVALEPNLRGTLDGLIATADQIGGRFRARKLDEQIASLRDELKRLTDAGHRDIAGRYAGRVGTVETRLKGGDGRYDSSGIASRHAEAARLEAERILLDRKNLDSFRELPSADPQTQNVRAGLSYDPLADLDNLLREEDRMQRIREEYRREREKDRLALAKTGSVDLQLTPPRPMFQPADILDGLGIDTRQDLSAPEIADHAAAAALAVADVLSDLATPPSVLLDLMSKTLTGLRTDMAASLFPHVDAKMLTPEQRALVDGLADEVFAKINSDAPNKVSADASTVQLGDQVFNKVKVLKSGGLGTATLYEDPVTGKKMVMKTPNAQDEQANADMRKEMMIMDRAQEGAAGRPQGSAIPQLFGAARSADGSTHMLMEFIDGGDMEEVGRTMNALGNSGFLPKAALTAMQGDMVLNVAKGLGELQRQGLMHHDIKGLNVMMTKTGDLRIIDYGESTFVSDDGTAKRKDMGLTTPGYAPDDAYRDGARVNVDNFALGSMLIDMVEQRSVNSRNQNETDTGALGRLIHALHKAPDQRVSLEGLAESAFMTAAEQGYGPEALKELRVAATEFTQETRAIKSAKTYDRIKDDLKDFKLADGQAVFTGMFPTSKALGLDDAQNLMRLCDDEIETIMRKLQSNPDRKTQEQLDRLTPQQRQAERDRREKAWLLQNRPALEALVRSKAYIQAELIDDMLDDAVAKADAAFQAAVADPQRKIDVQVFGVSRNLSLADAVAAHADLAEMLQTRRKATIAWLEKATGDPDQIQQTLDGKNEELVAIDKAASVLKQQIEDAAGPDARLRFVKQRLDVATVPFGPPQNRRTQDEVATDELDSLLAMLTNLDATDEIRRMATAG